MKLLALAQLPLQWLTSYSQRKSLTKIKTTLK